MENRVQIERPPEARNCKTAGELLRRLRWLKDEKERLEGLEKVVNKEIAHIEMTALPERLEGADLEQIKEAGVGSAKIIHDCHVYVPAAARGPLNEWMKQNGEGALVKEGVHPKTLQAWVRRQIEEGGEVPQHLINVTPYTGVKFRRS